MNYEELMDVLTNNDGGVNIELQRGGRHGRGKFVYVDDDGEFLGRKCRDCKRVILAGQLVKNSGFKYGNDAICTECSNARKRKNRECADYRRAESEYQKEYFATIGGELARIIGHLRESGRKYFGIEIPFPSDAERETLRNIIIAAKESGQCFYTGEYVGWENLSVEHPVATKRHDTAAYETLGGFWESIVFVSKSANSRKSIRSLLAYASDNLTESQQRELFEHLAMRYDVPFTDVFTALIDDDYTYRTGLDAKLVSA